MGVSPFRAVRKAPDDTAAVMVLCSVVYWELEDD